MSRTNTNMNVCSICSRIVMAHAFSNAACTELFSVFNIYLETFSRYSDLSCVSKIERHVVF